MPATDDTYTIASGADLWAGRDAPGAPIAPHELVADGVWTWFTEPRAVVSSDSTYIGWINSSGDAGVSKVLHSDLSVSSFTLRAAMQIDDHNNAAVHLRADGRVVAAYCRHPDSGADRHRVRITTNPGDVSAWGAEINPVANDPTYANLFAIGSRLFLNFRDGASTTRKQSRLASDDGGATWGSAADWITKTGERPYIKVACNGTRMDFLISTGHPAEVASSIYHAYMQPDGGGTEYFYQSDGTLIGTTMEPEQGTLIYDGSSVRAWCWDITYGNDGHPRVLFARFPSTTDHRYMTARWTGSAWTTPVEVCAGGSHLYSPEVYYSGGMCFDGNDPTRVFASVQVSGQWEIQEHRSADNGATWAKHRDITTGSAVRNIRPYSPRGHDGRIAVLWCRGTYTTYLNYATAIWGAG